MTTETMTATPAMIANDEILRHRLMYARYENLACAVDDAARYGGLSADAVIRFDLAQEAACQKVTPERGYTIEWLDTFWTTYNELA